MDLLKSHKRRSRLSESAYVALNIGLAATLFIIVLAVQSPRLAFAVVLLSKWRILAVRPRFWFANLLANTVDIIVGLGMVILLYGASGSVWLQAIIALLYAGWLLFVKPRSKRVFVAYQAGIALFVGITALSMVSFSWNIFFFVLIMWLLGYTVARHVLLSYEEPLANMYALVAGFITAELGWIGFHWLMAYPLPGFGTIQLSQLALFTTLFALVADRAYDSYHRHGVVRRADITLPVLLTVSIMVVVYVLAVLNGSDAL